MKPISENKIHGGVQAIYEHRSDACDCDMKVAVFMPPQGPVLIWLSGLTCTEQNFITKAGAQRLAAELGLIIVAPDTSPRGDHVPDTEDRYDFGKGAGFYLDATVMPWMENYAMETYIRDELPFWIKASLPMADTRRMGVFGHSMGGHGALTLHLKNPTLFKSCSAFSPIVAPSQVPWGQKAFEDYLGPNSKSWARYDATELVMKQPSDAHILIDQGTDDEFLKEHLRPDLFDVACQKMDQKLTLRLQDGYDHSYYFIASFIEDHLKHHAEALG